MREENIPHALIKIHAQEFIDIGAPFDKEVAMFQTHAITPLCIRKPATPRSVSAPEFWAELKRMLAQMALRR
ncbi:hypothetical protein D0T25_17190 [Duganella sp. BJB488]|nr:hypothetical protein D0T26_18340 [Duganella sp. BJB489]RFP20733.1 hypothetical protein D0T25_17190 [Duganella sp. BJB488]RFP32210.1 hypothetical protein D0T24_21715 [Duganella sp. BJB480]